MSYELINADCLEAMRQMEGCSVDAICTDPPYELGFMSKSWDSTGVAYRVETWSEASRVLKPGGHLLAFGGTRTYHRLACAIEDAGFEIRDTIQWIYGSGFPKSKSMRDIGKADLGSALKPAHEPIVMARKPLSESSIARQVLETGTGAINIDGCRVGVGEDVPGGGGWTGTGRHEGYQRPAHADGKPTEAHNKGRWPANLLLSHHESCQRIGTKRVRGYKGGDTVAPYASPITWSVSNTPGGPRKGHTDPDGMEEVESWECAPGCPVEHLGEPARFFKQFHEPDTGPGVYYARKASRRERTANGTVDNGHPTVKNLSLMKYLVRLVTPPDGTVLDPFMGTGTTGIAAIEEGFNFIGIESEAEYIQIARSRLEHHENEMDKASHGRLFA